MWVDSSAENPPTAPVESVNVPATTSSRRVPRNENPPPETLTMFDETSRRPTRATIAMLSIYTVPSARDVGRTLRAKGARDGIRSHDRAQERFRVGARG